MQISSRTSIFLGIEIMPRCRKKKAAMYRNAISQKFAAYLSLMWVKFPPSLILIDWAVPNSLALRFPEWVATQDFVSTTTSQE